MSTEKPSKGYAKDDSNLDSIMEDSTARKNSVYLPQLNVKKPVSIKKTRNTLKSMNNLTSFL